MTEYFSYLGMDVGGSVDYTALCVWTKQAIHDLDEHKTEEKNEVVHLERLSRDMSYPDQIERALEVFGHRGLRGTKRFIMDATGIGRPLVDLLVEKNIRPISIIFTGGHVTNEEPNLMFTVPKIDIINAGILAVELELVHVSNELPDAITLKNEMRDYQLKIKTKTGDEVFGAAAGANDDLVIAFSMCAWWEKREILQSPWPVDDRTDEDFAMSYDPYHRR